MWELFFCVSAVVTNLLLCKWCVNNYEGVTGKVDSRDDGDSDSDSCGSGNIIYQ